MADPANPFSGIFSTAEAAERQMNAVEEQRREMGDVLARVFLCTPATSVEGRASRPRCLVPLPQLARDLERSGKSAGYLDLDVLAKGVAERLQMGDPSQSLVVCRTGRTGWLYSQSQAVEKCSLTYLAFCYARVCREKSAGTKMEVAVHNHMVEECKKTIVDVCSVVIARPIHGVFNSLFTQSMQNQGGDTSVPMEFFYKIAEASRNDSQTLMYLFEQPLSTLTGSLSLSSSAPSEAVSILEVMVSSRHWTPQTPGRNGRSFETDTLLGRALRTTSVPQSTNKPSPDFPADMAILHRGEAETMRYGVQAQLQSHTARLHKVFEALLRSGRDTKEAVIHWLVDCLEANQDRGKMLARMQPVMGPVSTCAGDGFFLNLGWVMLKLAAPFAKRDAPLIRSIDPRYCSVRAEGRAQLDFSRETKMVPDTAEEGEESGPHTDTDTDFNFITQCFFLTHRTLTLGMSQIMQRFVDLMGVYERTFRTLQSIVSVSGPNGPLHQQLHKQFLVLHSQVQGFKAHMEDPQLQDLYLAFCATTARWLVWLATQSSHDSPSESHDPGDIFPLPTKAPPQMRMVPECLIDNMSHFFAHLRRSDSGILKSETYLLSHLVTFATVFMGSPQYIKNPHMRANIAQLVAMMIPPSDRQGLIPSDVELQRSLFGSHKVASAHLIRVLMRIFVDIEFTGDSMEFEAKFQYRIPMYNILKFVWVLPSYQPSIALLVQEAVGFDGSQQEIPSLLQFINMIINDATLQLDEGLENLVLIGELQKKRKAEWSSYNDEQKKEHQQKMQEATVMASNRNQLASYTVNVLELVTRELQAPFVLPSMVKRIAAMLNYVLKQLVGPSRRQLNVENMEKYFFNPKKLVSTIVSIYINLGQSYEFCKALPQDGRSFSLDLLEETVRIMRTLGHVDLMQKMNALTQRVQKYSSYLEMEETALDDAPEEFLDPVTSELMKEPVRLPTSGVTMDKSNILRHLFSDSTDPFNRSPLTADMLVPDHQLRQRIEDWKTEKLSHLRPPPLASPSSPPSLDQ